jgi:dipeptidase
MCDTMVRVTADGTFFAKNSDRDPNESQCLEWVAASDDAFAEPVRATYIDVESAAVRYAAVLSRPWWMFGAEMGVNEHGVAIGNEAVFTTTASLEPALLGMDIVRLALERARSAHEAVGVMVGLLERYGQGGPCSKTRAGFTYDNSYLIADPRMAIVLETAGREWATEEVHSGARSISNGLTIEGFAERFSRPVKDRLVACAARRRRTESSVAHATGVLDLMTSLREHGSASGPTWNPINGTLSAPCVHAGGWRGASQTTASLVADLRDGPTIFATATSSPCTSIFKPVSISESLNLGAPTDHVDDASLWWRHERVHRLAMRDYESAMTVIEASRTHLESSFVNETWSTREAFDAAASLEESWLSELGTGRDLRPGFVRRRWEALERAAT